MSAPNDSVLINRLRTCLLWLTVAVCVGIIAELWLTEHTKEPLQLLPLVVCGLGAVAALVVLFRPSRASIWSLRTLMLMGVVGGIIGTLAHLNGNLEFAREINAAKANAAPIVTALTGGNPPLAPGALAVTAVIALAATYWHPVLKQPKQ